MRRWLGAALLLLAGSAQAERAARPAVLLDPDDELLDKKARWLIEKVERSPRAAGAPAPAAEHPLTLRNMWTDEVWAIDPTRGAAANQAVFDRLLRCHFTQVETQMAPRLLGVVRAAAQSFHALEVELVSGYRAPKYQLMLRKKGHEVARDSAHPRGHAVDFRLPLIKTEKLLAFVRKQRAGGVGYYPVSRFVHVDVGPIRYWRGH